MFISSTWLVTPAMNSSCMEYFHYCRKFYWVVHITKFPPFTERQKSQQGKRERVSVQPPAERKPFFCQPFLFHSRKLVWNCQSFPCTSQMAKHSSDLGDGNEPVWNAEWICTKSFASREGRAPPGDPRLASLCRPPLLLSVLVSVRSPQWNTEPLQVCTEMLRPRLMPCVIPMQSICFPSLAGGLPVKGWFPSTAAHSASGLCVCWPSDSDLIVYWSNKHLISFIDQYYLYYLLSPSGELLS